MPKVTAYLDCGCAILEDGSRTWCPSCMADNALEQARGQNTPRSHMPEALQEIRELREALRRIERKAFNALLQPMRALEEIEAIAHKTLGGEHDCVRLG